MSSRVMVISRTQQVISDWSCDASVMLTTCVQLLGFAGNCVVISQVEIVVLPRRRLCAV